MSQRIVHHSLARCTMSFVALTICLILSWTTTTLPAATFKNLSERLPAHANVLILVNTEKILASPLAKEEGWRADHERQHQAGLTVVPPSSNRFLMAADLDLEFFQPIWQCAIAEVRYEPSVPKIAVRFGGTVDKIADRDAALLPDDTYLVKFGPKLAGTLSPANRQSATRWLRRVYSSGDKSQSDYLMEAMTYTDKAGTPIIMALDLSDSASPETIRSRLEALEQLADAKVDVDALSEFLATARGAMLGITIHDKIFGKLKVDFAEEVPLTPEQGKKLLLAVLEYRGAAVDDFYDWEPKVNGKQFSIEGPLYQSGMRRIFSILEPSQAMQESVAVTNAADEGMTEEALLVTSSQQYFKSTQQLLDDLKEKKPNGGFKTSGQIGVWYGKYADKIDRLPMANVDPELLSYGGFVSNSLRQARGSMHAISRRKRVRQADAGAQGAPTGQVTNTYAGGSRWGRYGTYGGGWGAGWSGRSYTGAEQRNIQQRQNTAIATEERMRGYGEVSDVMMEVENATSDIRRRMVEKYNVDF